MEFSWAVMIGALVINTVFLAVMFILQQIDDSLPSRNSIIPGTRQKFLYLQDFYTMKYGDTIGVPFIVNAVMTMMVCGGITPLQWMVFVTVTIADGLGFMKMCLGDNHKPDWGYPTIGAVSLGGLAHCLYHGLCIASTVLIVWHLFTDLRGMVLYTTLVGGAIYIATVVAEFKSGNFDPLKMDLHDPDPEHERQKNLEACC